MKYKFDRIAATLTVAGLAILSLYASCWAGPPPPPSIPATPVSGTEISIATAVVIAGYGYWKSRK